MLVMSVMTVGCSAGGNGTDELSAQAEASAVRPAAAVSDASVPPTSSSTTSTTGTTAAPTTTQAPLDPLNVFVSGSGSDDGWGTSESPFRSVAHALGAVADGGTLWLGDGDFGPVEVRNRRQLAIAAYGGATPTISGLGLDVGIGLLVVDSENITITGVDVTNSLAGVYIHRSSHVQFEANRVFSTGQEAIAVQQNSTEIDIVNNEIFSTGALGAPFSNFGEGIYIGSAAGMLDDGSRDNSSAVRIRSNIIHDVTAEAIDIKPFAADVLVEANLIYDVDTATSGAVVTSIGTYPTPDLGIVIQGNVIHSVNRTSSYRDGNGIVVSGPAEVYANVVYQTQHFGILVDRNTQSTEPSQVIIRNNVVRSAGVEAVGQHSDPAGLEIVIEDNSTEADVISQLGDSFDVEAAQIEAQRLLDEVNRDLE